MFRVGVDIGGTFTDCVVQTSDGTMVIVKSPSTPGDFARGFMDALKVAADRFEFSLADFLARVDVIVHGTTVSTNALVTRRTAPTGLIATRGHPDVLTLREAPRKKAWEWRLDYPDPFVPRNRTMEVGGRIDSLGNEVEPLSEEDVRAATRRLRQAGVEAIAVSLLWAFVNPSHELRAAAIIDEEWPGVPVSMGHRVNPIPREYRRTIATAIDASLRPVVNAYIEALTNSLTGAGFQGKLLIANCTGGMMPPDEIVASPIQSVMSGPTMAPVAARHAVPGQDVVVADMGGTTFDVAAIRSGQILVTPEAMIYDHDMLGLPKADVRSVGAGGGSIAWVDDGGLLHVGPQSAGARPGPACYGHGGDQATVTDANVVLQVLNPTHLLNGRMKIDQARAKAAIGRLADQLGLGVMETAQGIISVVIANMAKAIRVISVERGYDPRDYVMLGFGGAGPIHAARLARELEIPRLVIPKYPGIMCALGLLLTDLRTNLSLTRLLPLSAEGAPGMESGFAGLEERAQDWFAQEAIPEARRSLIRSVDMRYGGQGYELTVPCPAGPIDAAALVKLRAEFERIHKQVYGYIAAEEPVQVTTLRIEAVGLVPKADLKAYPSATEPVEKAITGHREVWLPETGGFTHCPIYDRERLGPGHKVTGPAIIDQMDSTTLVLPQQVATVDAHLNLIIEG